MRIPSKTIILSALATLVFVGAGCSLLGGGSTIALKPITLQYWRIQDSSEALADTVTAYQKLHPNVTIKVQTLREEDYEQKLLEAIAEDRGPDLFSIQNLSLREWSTKVLPMPKETVIPTPTAKGDKIVVVAQKKPTVSLLTLRNNYVEGVANEIVMPYADKDGAQPTDRIFGLPFSADTLALFYNKDIFKKANIEKPPATWSDFQPMAARLTIADGDGKIRQSGASIGGAKNVRYSADLLSAIMLQNGAIVSDENGYANFDKYTPSTRDRTEPPGVESLIFYQSFADKGTPAYTWNEALPDSLDAFIGGTSAMFFGYPSDIIKVRERAPRLDFAVAPLPQIDMGNPKNVLRYPIEVVSRKTKNADTAWDFLQFAASQEQVASFLTKTGRPTALRTLIGTQVADPAVATFANQVLTAQRWYGGIDFTKANEAYIEMITTRPTIERPEYKSIVNYGVSAINSTIR